MLCLSARTSGTRNRATSLQRKGARQERQLRTSGTQSRASSLQGRTARRENQQRNFGPEHRVSSVRGDARLPEHQHRSFGSRSGAPPVQDDTATQEHRSLQHEATVVKGFQKGDIVTILSDAGDQWYRDGLILEVFPTEGTCDGYAIPAGSIKVKYVVGTKLGTKWIMADMIEGNLRHQALLKKQDGASATEIPHELYSEVTDVKGDQVNICWKEVASQLELGSSSGTDPETLPCSTPVDIEAMRNHVVSDGPTRVGVQDRILPELPCAPPEAPEAHEARMSTRAVLSWFYPASDGGAPITHFIIMVRCVSAEGAPNFSEGSDQPETLDSGACGNAWDVETNNARTQHTVTGLAPGAAYEFRIRAVSHAGQSKPSQASEIFTTGPRPPSAPGRPWLIGPSITGPHEPMMTFTAPEEADDFEIQRFRCVAFVQGKPEETTEAELKILKRDGNVLTAVAMGVHGNRDLQFAVQAYGDGGWGQLGPSSPLAFVWSPVPPRRLIPSISDSGRMCLAWDAAVDQSGNMITAYSLYITHHHEYEDQFESEQYIVGSPLVSAATGSDLIAHIPDLRGNTTYSFRLQAADGDEPRPVSGESQLIELPLFPPSAPGRPSASTSSTKDNALLLDWTAAASDGGEPLLGYKVLIHKLNAAVFLNERLMEEPLTPPWVESTVTKGMAAHGDRVDGESLVSYKCMNLLPGNLYCFQVKAVNSQGASKPSLCSEIVRIKDTVPSRCRGLVARQVGPVEVALSWQPPTDSGGSQVTEYQVVAQLFRADDENIVDTACQQIDADGLNLHWIRHIWKNLRPASEYKFSVAAKNFVGVGATANTAWSIKL